METKPRASFPKVIGSKNVHVEVNPKEAKVLNKRHLSASVTLEFYNFTGQTIKTLDHLGLCTIHKPLTTSPDERSFIGCFVIKRISSVNDSAQVVEMSDAVKGSRFAEFNEQMFNELLLNINHKSREEIRRRTSSAYFSIAHTLISKNGGSIYVRDVDIVVFNDKCTHEIIHPNSPRAIDAHIDQIYSASHTYSIEINDPENSNCPFYINLNDRVFTIKPTCNPNLGEEVRIVFKAPNEQAETIYLGIIDETELAKIGVFRNYMEADKYGEKLEIFKSQQEIELAQAKANLEKTKVDSAKETSDIKLTAEYKNLELKISEMTLKQEQAELAYKAELEKRDRDNEQAKRDLILERERSELQMQQLKMKDYYEYRSHERKDSSEGLKMLPVLAGGALALFALLK